VVCGGATNLPVDAITSKATRGETEQRA
jgi:hypothetical protein